MGIAVLDVARHFIIARVPVHHEDARKMLFSEDAFRNGRRAGVLEKEDA
jgi:hypothetical protein